jgi:hypothetical protein
MLTRVNQLIAGDIDRLWGGTFHHIAIGFCGPTAPCWAMITILPSWTRKTPVNS